MTRFCAWSLGIDLRSEPSDRPPPCYNKCTSVIEEGDRTTVRFTYIGTFSKAFTA